MSLESDPVQNWREWNIGVGVEVGLALIMRLDLGFEMDIGFESKFNSEVLIWMSGTKSGSCFDLKVKTLLESHELGSE